MNNELAELIYFVLKTDLSDQYKRIRNLHDMLKIKEYDLRDSKREIIFPCGYKNGSDLRWEIESFYSDNIQNICNSMRNSLYMLDDFLDNSEIFDLDLVNLLKAYKK